MTRFHTGIIELSPLIEVVRNARAMDRAEAVAVVGAWSPDEIARGVFEAWACAGAWGGIYFMDDVPYAFLTATRVTPRCLSVSLLATDAFGSGALWVTRSVLRDLLPLARELGYHRAECRCLSSHGHARRWMENCGARFEARIEGYGAHGETFDQMAWRLQCA